MALNDKLKVINKQIVYYNVQDYVLYNTNKIQINGDVSQKGDFITTGDIYANNIFGNLGVGNHLKIDGNISCNINNSSGYFNIYSNTNFYGNLDLGTFKATTSYTPLVANDLTNKKYVDNFLANISTSNIGNINSLVVYGNISGNTFNGTSVVIDNARITNGDLLVVGNITANTLIGNLVADNSRVTNGLTAGSITVSGNITANTLIANLVADNSRVTNGLKAGSLTVSGNITANTLIGNLVANNLRTNTLSVSGNISANLRNNSGTTISFSNLAYNKTSGSMCPLDFGTQTNNQPVISIQNNGSGSLTGYTNYFYGFGIANRNSTGYLDFISAASYNSNYTNNVKMCLDQNGRLGIINTLPNANLHVGGNAIITGNTNINGQLLNVTGNITANTLIGNLVADNSRVTNGLTAGTLNVSGNITANTLIGNVVGNVYGNLLGNIGTDVSISGNVFLQQNSGIYLNEYNPPSLANVLYNRFGNLYWNNTQLDAPIGSYTVSNIIIANGGYQWSISVDGSTGDLLFSKYISGSYVVKQTFS